VGVRPERFSLDWASAAEAPLYVQLITEFTDRIRDLGPLGEAEGQVAEDLKLRLAAARSAVSGTKLRTRFGRLTLELRQGNDYSEEAIKAKMAEKLNDAISKEIEKQGGVSPG
jgi:hypothetical protein